MFARNDADALGDALELHDHSSGKGLPVNSIPSGGLTVSSGTINFTGATVIPALTNSSSALGAPVTIAVANTYYVGASLVLGAGTWLLLGYTTVTGPTAGSSEIVALITDGSTNFASAEQTTGAASRQVNLVVGPVIATGAATYSLKVTADAGTDASIRSACAVAGTPGNATRLTAIRIA